MSKKLLIVFVKNTKLGTVKTRLAKSIGDAAALKIYSALVRHTKHVTNSMTMDTHVYFSTNNGAEKWNNASINIQVGSDLGERMSDAFKKGKQVDYVLGNWDEEEKTKLPERLEIASEIIKSFVLAGLEITMTSYNGK